MSKSASNGPTIRDVAKRASVGLATVSRVLNGSAPVAFESSSTFAFDVEHDVAFTLDAKASPKATLTLGAAQDHWFDGIDFDKVAPDAVADAVISNVKRSLTAKVPSAIVVGLPPACFNWSVPRTGNGDAAPESPASSRGNADPSTADEPPSVETEASASRTSVESEQAAPTDRVETRTTKASARIMASGLPPKHALHQERLGRTARCSPLANAPLATR